MNVELTPFDAAVAEHVWDLERQDGHEDFLAASEDVVVACLADWADATGRVDWRDDVVAVALYRFWQRGEAGDERA